PVKHLQDTAAAVDIFLPQEAGRDGLFDGVAFGLPAKPPHEVPRQAIVQTGHVLRCRCHPWFLLRFGRGSIHHCGSRCRSRVSTSVSTRRTTLRIEPPFQALTRAPISYPSSEIGRAACRESLWRQVVAVVL